jgi:hypothetical protein
MGSKKKRGFSPPPVLSQSQKKKLARQFVNSAGSNQKLDVREKHDLHLRLPPRVFDDLVKLSLVSQKSYNTICADILRDGVKQKLKEYEDEG